ncbi:hypothetical protein [Piscinibacter sp. XHJ-5]|uniref:hypothetical protein n=1 Tax=Piscinibacter sp. XHJ-5 TaxID=3037797 RepID=UPI002452F100|nr:hypothetical protein [Piscinibacter sp. XHJ-5]
MASDGSRALIEGLTDAAGFFIGGLAGAWLARMLGFDFLAPGYGGSVMVGLLMVGIGGGIGLRAARAFRARLAAREEEHKP